jgi:cysteinyl-tRNA synthetase
LTWDLARSELPPATKKATLLEIDKVLGLNIAAWQPSQETIPGELQALLEERQQARQDKRWQDADRIRQQIIDSGYELEDTPQGPRLKRRKL